MCCKNIKHQMQSTEEPQRESLLQRTGIHTGSLGGFGCGKDTVPSKSPDCGQLDVERKCDHFRKRPQVAWMGPGGGNQKEEAGPRLATKEAKESPSPLSGERPRAKYRHPFSHLTLEENQPREAQKLLPVRSRSARLSAPEPPHPGVPGGLS